MEATGLGKHLHHPGQQPLGAQLFGGALDIRGQGFFQAFQFGNPGPEGPGTDKAFCRGRNLLEGDARYLSQLQDRMQPGDGQMLLHPIPRSPLKLVGGGSAIGFELCDAASSCRFVNGDLSEDTILLPADASARTVRYLWQASPIVNLYNKAELPATGFSMPIE